MDHLTYPIGATLKPVEIPFLACETYDSSGFDTWPGRRGWAEGVWSDNALSSTDIARLAQEWLFFGLLKECLLFENDFNDFIYTTPDHRMLVTTSLLPLLCRQWTQRVRSKQATTNAVNKISLALDVVEDKLPSPLASPHAGAWPSSHIFFSIYCLANSLRFFVGTRKYSKGRYFAMSKVEFPRHSLSWLESRLRKAGWCFRQIESVIRKYPPFVMYYLSSIPRSEPTDITHAQCSRLRCSANNVHEDDYITRHYEDCESCESVHSPLAELIKITENGGIPLLSVYESSNQDTRYDFVEYKIGMTFGAISHVWSGGLGNFTANAMPSCQVTRIFSAIHHAIRDWSIVGRIKGDHGNRALFWIDTLCIPIGPPKIRLAAISRMAQIYAAATAVLVLDRELQTISFQSLAKEQTMSHILASAWSSRSWTLHEAALAQNLVFQFRDGLFKLRPALSRNDYQPAVQTADLIDWLMPSNTLFSFDHIIRSDVEDSLGGMRPVGAAYVPYFEAVMDTKFVTDYEVERCEQFTTVWNSLADRDTTKKDDLHGILATLLDLRASEVLNLPRNARMKAIIKAQSRLPFHLLCSPQSSGIEDLSVRWLPQFPEVVMKSWGVSLKLTDSGLLINHSDAQRGLLLEGHDRCHKLIVKMQTTPSEMLYIQLHYSETDAYVDPPNTRSYIMIDEGTNPMQGFRLCVLDPFLRQGLYDCPVTVWKKKPANIDFQATPTTTARLSPLTKDFLIRSDTSQWPRLGYRRSITGANSIRSLNVRRRIAWLALQMIIQPPGIFMIEFILLIISVIMHSEVAAWLFLASFIMVELYLSINILFTCLQANADQRWWLESFGTSFEPGSKAGLHWPWNFKKRAIFKDEWQHHLYKGQKTIEQWMENTAESTNKLWRRRRPWHSQHSNEPSHGGTSLISLNSQDNIASADIEH